MADIDYDEIAVMDDMKDVQVESEQAGVSGGGSLNRHEKSPVSKTRSLSDGGGTQLSPSPQIVKASRRESKDDSSLRDSATAPVTPRRPDFPIRGLSLQMPQRDTTLSQSQAIKPPPLSPKLDQSQIYASPTNILPRRSRGLDFSRAATSLHHSTLAEQSSPASSPTVGGGRAMNIPGRRLGEYGAENTTGSLWHAMGRNQEKMNMSNSLGSNVLGSDSSSSSDNEDLMDEDMEDNIMGTPQVAKGFQSSQGFGSNAGVPWLPGNSPAANSLASFRTRPRKPPKKKLRSLLGLHAGLSKSPPNNIAKEVKDVPATHSRRESISWAANQLHISGSETEEKAVESGDSTPSKDGQKGVIKRVVTRRGNLLPKTKGFARIRAALAEENMPVDSEVRREAEVIKQVRESDMGLEPRVPHLPLPPLDIVSAQSSPNLNTESLDDIPEDEMMCDAGLSGSFKQQVLKNSKGKIFWDTFSESSSVAGNRTTPPPPAFLPRGSSSGISDDVNMDSPSLSAAPGPSMIGNMSDSQRSDTPQASASAPPSQRIPPTAEEITRRINNKRRRGDDDIDSISFKRRAVSPGMSVHNSPIMQSPLQRDLAPWGSRPGSNGGDKASGTSSDNGSSGGNSGGGPISGRPINGAKGRVGYQGMVDTNDGLMRMSIE